MSKAVFLDRDGVITKMVSYNGEFDPPKAPTDVKLVEGIIEVISWLNKRNIPIIEITNQPGVALGKFDFQTLEKIEKRVHSLLAKEGVKINKVYRCIHHPKAVLPDLKIECDCRKPKTGMLIQAANDLGITLNKSILVGDNASDINAGKKVGAKTVLFYHTNDMPEKNKAKKASNPDVQVTSHEEVLLIMKEFFK